MRLFAKKTRINLGVSATKTMVELRKNSRGTTPRSRRLRDRDDQGVEAAPKERSRGAVRRAPCGIEAQWEGFMEKVSFESGVEQRWSDA